MNSVLFWGYFMPSSFPYYKLMCNFQSAVENTSSSSSLARLTFALVWFAKGWICFLSSSDWTLFEGSARIRGDELAAVSEAATLAELSFFLLVSNRSGMGLWCVIRAGDDPESFLVSVTDGLRIVASFLCLQDFKISNFSASLLLCNYFYQLLHNYCIKNYLQLQQLQPSYACLSDFKSAILLQCFVQHIVA